MPKKSKSLKREGSIKPISEPSPAPEAAKSPVPKLDMMSRKSSPSIFHKIDLYS
jgi:hypothetical protein